MSNPTASGAPATRSERRDGFEFQGTFYRFAVSDSNKDLILIDKFTEMAPHEFFEIVESGSIFERMRGPRLLALVATSIRHANPDWTVERIYRLVVDEHFSNIAFIFGEDEEGTELDGPPSSGPAESTGDSSPDGSSSSATPPESSESETSSETPPFSGHPGSLTGSPASETPPE